MVEEGESAPSFELPAVREGEFEQFALDEHLGEDVVILAFYPGDFNPACDGSSSGLDDLDLFTMQKDITILAVSGDSVFSHRAFAEEYDLHIPLLADVRGDVATEYGVAAEADRHATRRAVFVIDHTGEVEYRWVADDIEELPRTDEIRGAVENIGDDETARARYRVGHAHYVEGRRAFTSAMGAYEDREWMLSGGDFAQAADEFDEAREEFNTAVRFSDDEDETRYFERAERKAEALWRAANWLNDAMNAFASGEGQRGDELRQDAEGPLETARDIHEPIDPDDFPPEESPEEQDTDSSFLPTDDDAVDANLDLDEAAVADSSRDSEAEFVRGSTGPVDADEPVDDSARTDAETEAAATEEAADGAVESDIDDAELEAITAELEEQNDQSEGTDSALDDSEGSASGPDDSDVDSIGDEVEDDDLELELSDPTDAEDESDEDEEHGELGEDNIDDLSGDHGVPDSL